MYLQTLSSLREYGGRVFTPTSSWGSLSLIRPVPAVHPRQLLKELTPQGLAVLGATRAASVVLGGREVQGMHSTTSNHIPSLFFLVSKQYYPQTSPLGLQGRTDTKGMLPPWSRGMEGTERCSQPTATSEAGVHLTYTGHRHAQNKFRVRAHEAHKTPLHLTLPTQWHSIRMVYTELKTTGLPGVHHGLQ